MQFDDRLATVLRHRASGVRAAHTQFRQLLDLLGARRSGSDQKLLAAAWLRLGALGEMIPAAKRAAMVQDPGLRFRNPELAAHLAEEEPEVAAAALTRVQLSNEDWEALIPRLPVRARGFLRLRRDLPAGAIRLLERLGVHDRGLPVPVATQSDTAAPSPAPIAANDGDLGVAHTKPRSDNRQTIGAIVERIEAYKRSRTQPGTRIEAPDHAPRLPLNESGETEKPPISGFAFTTDAEGRIDWAEPSIAPMVFGTLVAKGAAAKALRGRQPVHSAVIELTGAPAITGKWLVDAAPRFTSATGRYFGYAGKFRRPAAQEGMGAAKTSPESDRIRELLHELRTPINAIQGFAEVIQQQVFGPVPSEYRAHAASIAGDAARMLGGFEELDRLAKLETGAIELEQGACDFAAIVAAQLDQLGTVIQARMAGFTIDIATGPASVPLDPADGQALAWRVLATLAGHLSTGEQCEVQLATSGTRLTLEATLPTAFADQDDIFSSDIRPKGGALSAGTFGSGFALRLARAEAQAVGGGLTHVDDRLALVLPLLTGSDAEPSDQRRRSI